MSTTTVEWIFEGPDPEVGIFGDLILHPCSDDTEPATLSDHTLRDAGPDLVEDVTTYACACGATTTVTEQWPRSFFEDEDWPVVPS